MAKGPAKEAGPFAFSISYCQDCMDPKRPIAGLKMNYIV